MAFYDDRRFLLSHIRHSFITSDPTETCEMVMLHETMPHFFGSESDSKLIKAVEVDAKSELLDTSHSCEVPFEYNYIGAHRNRSNTAQRLERMKEEKKTAAKIQIIRWKDYGKTATETQLEEMFPQKNLNPLPEQSAKELPKVKKSALSLMVERFPENPFSYYARFDARVGDRRRTRSYEIILHVLPKEIEDKQIQVVIFTNARVKDLIGLICWLYTNEQREPPMNADISKYSLRIAEDNGDIDTDFPSLDPSDFVEKYEFRILALVEGTDDHGSLNKAEPFTVTKEQKGEFKKFYEIGHNEVGDNEIPLDKPIEQKNKSKSNPLKKFRKYWMSQVKSKKDDHS